MPETYERRFVRLANGDGDGHVFSPTRGVSDAGHLEYDMSGPCFHCGLPAGDSIHAPDIAQNAKNSPGQP